MMNTKHPAYYIVLSLGIVLGAFAAFQLFLNLYREPFFWRFLIVALSAAIVVLTISLLLYTRKISPRMKLLPPPLQ